MKKAGALIGLFFLGAAVGAAARILLAPVTGSENREKLANTTKDFASRLTNLRNRQLNGHHEIDEYEAHLRL